MEDEGERKSAKGPIFANYGGKHVRDGGSVRKEDGGIFIGAITVTRRAG